MPLQEKLLLLLGNSSMLPKPFFLPLLKKADCDKKWSPVWISQPIASSGCLELVKCGCKSEKGCVLDAAAKKLILDALNYASTIV